MPQSWPTSGSGSELAASPALRERPRGFQQRLRRPAGWVGVSPRTRALQAVLIGACAVGMLASAPLWCNTRSYPRVPVLEGFPALPAPWDAWFLGALLISLLLSPWLGRMATTLFLAGSAFLALGDQNRWQPWFYLYWILLALTLAREPTALAGMRWVVSAVYLWSGLQKFNPGFGETVVPFFVQPLASWLPTALLPGAKLAIMTAPAIEVLVGLALWIPTARRAAIAAVVTVHAVALLVLGPLGHKHNFIVWPWNFGMVLFVVLLFPPVSFAANWQALRRSASACLAVLLVITLPGLSFFGWWDSYLSFALYSGNLASAEMYVTPALADRLPPHIQKMLVPVRGPFDPEREGPWKLNHQGWCALQTGVPPLPEPRGYLALARHIARFAPAPNDFHMVLVARNGTTNYYTASDFH